MNEHALSRPTSRSFNPAVRVFAVLACGLAVGALTSLGQTYLSGPLEAFVNSASAWLVVPFLLGSRMRTLRGAAIAGVAVCVFQLVGYDVTSELRGFSAGGSIVAFWLLCAAVGGPLFGGAGWLWRNRTDHLRGLGAAVLPAAFFAEGLWVYVHELHYYGTAALWIGIGALLSLAMVRRPHQWVWLLPSLFVGLIGEVMLTSLYTQSF